MASHPRRRDRFRIVRYDVARRGDVPASSLERSAVARCTLIGCRSRGINPPPPPGRSYGCRESPLSRARDTARTQPRQGDNGFSPIDRRIPPPPLLLLLLRYAEIDPKWRARRCAHLSPRRRSYANAPATEDAIHPRTIPRAPIWDLLPSLPRERREKAGSGTSRDTDCMRARLRPA